MVSIKFIKSTENGYKEGEVVNGFSLSEAKEVVNEGYAEIIGETTKEQPKLKEVKDDYYFINRVEEKIFKAYFKNKFNDILHFRKHINEICPIQTENGTLTINSIILSLAQYCLLYDVPYTQDDLKDEYEKEKKKFAESIEKAKKSIGKVQKSFISPSFNLPIDNYMENAERFHKFQPYFYDKTGMFWFWDSKEHKYHDVDDVDVMNMFDKVLGYKGQTINAKIKTNTLEAMKRVGRDKHPKEAKKQWIQFKDKAYSLTSKEIYEVTPDYLFTNPIPWEMGTSDETPTIDKLFKEWVGEKYVKTLYEVIAYCCIRDYPLHLIFCLIGCGRNGKSKFIGLLNRFIGKDNICSTELDTLLNSRFESVKLFRKMVCSLGETNFGILNKTSLLKKLCGQDLIGFEFKNKLPFDDYNYAKIVISSNSLPTSEDTSEGFYRRWLIVDFPNTFEEGKDILSTIPEQEYNNLALKVTKILPNLLDIGKFTNQGNIEERKAKYIMSSNPLPGFINFACKKGVDLCVKYSEFYNNYAIFLNKIKKRVVSKKEFVDVLVLEGYEISRTTKKINGEFVNDRFVLGLAIDETWESRLKNYDSYDGYDTILNSGSHIRGTELELKHNCHNRHNLQHVVNLIKQIPKDNYEIIESIFGKEEIDYYKSQGDLFELKKGTLSYENQIVEEDIN